MTETRQVKRRIPADQRRERIIEAARAAFAEHGYAGANMRSIAAAADVREAMVYRHFASKDELFEEAVAAPLEAAMQRQIELYTQPTDDGATVRQRSEIFVRDMLGAMDEVGPLVAAVMLSDRDRAAKFYREHLGPTLTRGTEETAKYTDLWNARPFDPALALRMAWATCWFLALERRLGEGITTPNAQLATQIVDTLFDGLRARPDDQRDRRADDPR